MYYWCGKEMPETDHSCSHTNQNRIHTGSVASGSLQANSIVWWERQGHNRGASPLPVTHTHNTPATSVELPTGVCLE